MTTRIALIAGHRYGRRLAEAILEAAKDPGLEFTDAFLLHPRNLHRYGGYESAFAPLRAADVPITVYNEVAELSGGALSERQPQFVLVCGLRQIIPVELLWQVALENGATQVHSERSGFIAFHPSALPDGAGLAPVQWTIFERMRHSSVSAFFIDDRKIDGGPIIGRHDFSIEPDADASALDRVIGDSIAGLFMKLTLSLRDGRLSSTPQPKIGRRVRPQIPISDRWIDFAWPAERISQMIRAFTKPYGGTAALVEGRPVLIYKAQATSHDVVGGRANEVYRSSKELVVGCRDGAIRLIELEYLDR